MVGKDKRTEKECTSCKETLPNNAENFRLDSAKVRLGHNIVLSAKCIECEKKKKRESQRLKREKLRELGITIYSTFSEERKEYNRKRNNEYSKLNREKINQKCRERRVLKTIGVINQDINKREENRESVNKMTDYYIARLIFRNNKELTVKELLQYPELLDLHRANLKLKRICNQLKISTN